MNIESGAIVRLTEVSESCLFVAKDPLPTDPLPVEQFVRKIKNGKVFEMGGAFGKFLDKREIPFVRIFGKLIIMDFSYKDSE
jgi:hypothetical protein